MDVKELILQKFVLQD